MRLVRHKLSSRPLRVGVLVFHVQQGRGVHSSEEIGLAPPVGICVFLGWPPASCIRRYLLWELRPPMVRVSTVHFRAAPLAAPWRLVPKLCNERPGVVAFDHHGHGVFG